MGRPAKYTPKELEEAVERYFASITRVVEKKEPVPTGEKDQYGHEIYEYVPIINSLGQPVTVTEYVLPPTVADLCLFLGIEYGTWENYCKQKRYFRTTTHARERMRAWNLREMLTRPGKDVRGIIFNLQNNYGMRERTEVEIGPEAAKAEAAKAITLGERLEMLKQIAADFGEAGGHEETEEQ